jgi:hypothetical protein
MSRKENPETPNETLSGTPHVVKQDFRTLGLTFFFRSQFLSSSLTFALNSHFRSSRRRIPFAFNVTMAETRQVKTLPLF